MSNLMIEQLPISALKPWAKNARKHSKKQIRQIASSIREFGFSNPILVDRKNTILAGHGRVEAARLLEMEELPCVRLESLSEDQKRAYVLADNKLALNATWDEDLLAEELGALLDVDIELDVEVTGFSVAEVDSLVEGLSPEEPGDPADDLLPDFSDTSPTCRKGDVWQLGPHRLICGDALNPKTIDLLMDGHAARMIFTDPPYNVRIDGHVGGLGNVKHREFEMASGEMNAGEFTQFLKSAFRNLADASVDGAIHFVCMDWRHMSEILEAGNSVYTELKNLVIWAKDNGGMGSFYRSRHELIFVFKSGSEPHLNSFELGQHGRYRTNVWEYRGANSVGATRASELRDHPTPKPVQMVADAIKDVSARGDIVLDAFGGLGSTMIAAEKTVRRAFLCEIDPVYCDRIIRRWESFAKDEAVQLVCGLDSGFDKPNYGDQTQN